MLEVFEAEDPIPCVLWLGFDRVDKNRTIARKALGQMLLGKCSGQFRATRSYIGAVGPTDRTPSLGFRLAMTLP
ncbi:MAG TPA: hypothetical protein VE262_24870 [Blastocatellia bacterium]|nr:hypothetical protein [Blastocatellia bacterium]